MSPDCDCMSGCMSGAGGVAGCGLCAPLPANMQKALYNDGTANIQCIYSVLQIGNVKLLHLRFAFATCVV